MKDWRLDLVRFIGLEEQIDRLEIVQDAVRTDAQGPREAVVLFDNPTSVGQAVWLNHSLL